ncbi:hypothetical protein O3M35_000315 [Rhynocoris fuscipes]|uniref:MD-2-related lipid-recognition domain-containing protein n=1 Tax=Rhynocoris fuscipes TaxID=488301 RepID=A0AAW1DRJ7_9HEMI
MFKYGIFLLFLSFTIAERVQFQPCDSKSQEICKVYDLDVEPCPNGDKGEPCKMKRGTLANLSFKYNPTWSQEGVLKTRAYWVSMIDIPFAGIDTDGCKVTKCPPVQNAENFYNYSLNIADSFPPKKYDVKFKLWDDRPDSKKNACCLIFKLKIL